MQSIYNYQDYRLFLRDFHTECCQRNPKFSLRAFAARLGINASNMIRILNGQRNISASSQERIVTFLKLRDREAEYFNLLVQYNQSKNPADKRALYAQVLLFRKTRLRNLGKDHDEYFSSWYNVALRELLNILPCKATSQELSAMLLPSPRPNEIRKALNLLKNLGLITRCDDGKYSLTQQLVSTPTEWTSTAIHSFQSSMADLGKEALDRFSKNERDISTLTLSLSGDGVTKIKDVMKRARDEMLEIASTDTHCDRVCQINLQLFPLSTVQKES